MEVNVESPASFICPSCGSEIDSSEMEVFATTPCPSCSESHSVPGKFGDYLLLEQLGEGFMSVVFRAIDIKLARIVAVKVLNKLFSKDEKVVAAFKQEAKAASSINHMNVVKVYEFGEAYNQPFMSMEYIKGQHLNEILETEDLSEERILEIGIGIAQGLEEAQESGLIHGGIMPRNILVDDKGVPKVSDFGLARVGNKKHEHHAAWSSPYYISPEHIKGAPEDHRGDIYSLGTTLFFMLTGRLPYFDLDDQEVARMKVESEAPTACEYEPKTHVQTANLIARMLSIDPDGRPDNYEALCADFEAVRMVLKGVTPTNFEADTVPIEGLQLEEPKPARRKKQVEKIAAFAALLMIAGIGAYAVILSKGDKEPGAAAEQLPLAKLEQTRSEELRKMTAAESNKLSKVIETTAMEASPAIPERPESEIAAAEEPSFEILQAVEPTAIQALGLWLRADKGVERQGMRVTSWKDVSGNAHSADQADRIYQPAWHPTAANGNPALLFDDKLLESSLKIQDGSDFTVFVVLKDAGSLDGYGSEHKMILSTNEDAHSSGTGAFGLYVEGEKSNRLGFSGLGQEIIPAAQPHAPQDLQIVSFSVDYKDNGRAEAHCQMGEKRFDYPVLHDSNAPSENNAMKPIQIGGVKGMDAYFTGFVAELIVYKRSLTPYETNSVGKYLKDKYQL